MSDTKASRAGSTSRRVRAIVIPTIEGQRSSDRPSMSETRRQEQLEKLAAAGIKRPTSVAR